MTEFGVVTQVHYDNERNWPCFTTQHQTCKTKTKTTAYKTKTKTDCLDSDWSCAKTDGLRPHHCTVWETTSVFCS